MKLFEQKVVKEVASTTCHELFEEYITRGWRVVKLYPLSLPLDSKGWCGAVAVLRRNAFRRWRFDR